jgi:hypothetical protein
MDEVVNAVHCVDAQVVRGAGSIESADAHGRYDVVCFGPDGEEKWRDTIENVVVTVGKNLALDTFLAGSGYTVVGPFMGLISSVGYSAIAASDTMTSHPGWTEAGGANAPTYNVPRKMCLWSAASSASKSLSAALMFAITATGTIKGAFLVFGTGALNTIDSTSGVLYSAGLFSHGDKVVGNGDTLNCSFSASM